MSPTALNKRGTKIHMDGFTFDSQKECNFYVNFIRDSGRTFRVHPDYELVARKSLAEFNTHVIGYKPDIVTYNETGKISHVYDVKNSFGEYGIDASVKLRFTLFARRYGIPVEAVVVRAHDFKVIAFGTTKTRNIKQPLIRTDIFYDWHMALKGSY